MRAGNPAAIDMTASSGSSLTYSGPPAVNAPFTVQADFSAIAYDFTVDDLELSNATASDFTEITTNLTYQFQVNPVAEGEVAVTVPYGAAFDDNSELTGRSNTVRVQYDTTAPVINSVTNTLASSPTNAPEFTLLFDVSEPLDVPSLHDAMNDSISSTGGLDSSVLPDGVDAQGRHIIRILSLAGFDGIVSFAALPAGAVTDEAGNPTITGPTSMPADVRVDRLAPTVSVDWSSVDGGNTIVSGSAISASEVTAAFTFSEPVGGLDASDFIVTWSGSPAPAAGVLSVVDNTASFRVGSIEGDGDLTIQLVDAAASDGAGNTSPAASLDLVISNEPIVADIRNTRSQIFSRPGTEEVNFVINWNKRVSDLDVADLSIVTSGSVTVDGSPVITSQDHNPNRSIVEVTLLTEIDGIGNLQLQVAAGSVLDDYGNTPAVAFSSSPPTPVNQAAISAGPFTFSDYDSIVMNELATHFAELTGSRIDFNGFELTPRDGEALATVTYDNLSGLLTFDGVMRLGSGGEIFAEDSALQLDLFSDGIGYLTLLKAPFGFDVASGEIELLGAQRQILGVDFSLDGMALSVAVGIGPQSRAMVLPGVSITQLDGGFVKTLPTTARDRVLIVAIDWRSRRGAVLPVDGFNPVVGGYDLGVSMDTNSSRYDSEVVGRITGSVALRDDSVAFEGFVLEAAGFPFSPLDVSVIPNTPDNIGVVSFFLPSYEGDGIRGELNEIRLRTAGELVGGDHLTLTTLFAEPIAVLDDIHYQSDRIYTGTAQILADRGDPIRAEWLAANPAIVQLPLAHAIPLGPDGLTVDMRGPAGAYIDSVGYHSSELEIPSNFGFFVYEDVIIYHESRTSDGELVSSPSVGINIGFLPFANISMPFRITSVYDQLRFTGDINLPGRFQLFTLMRADGVFAASSSEFPINEDSLTRFDSCVPEETPETAIPAMPLATVPPFCLRFSKPPPTWLGSLKTKLPVRTAAGDPFELEGEGEIIDGDWNRIEVKISGFEKPIGTTGAFLTSLGAGLDNLAQVESCWFEPPSTERKCGVKRIDFIGNAEIAMGPKIKQIPTQPRLLVGPIDIRVNDKRVQADGTLRLLHPSGPELGEAMVTVNFPEKSFRATSDATGFPGLTGSTEVTGEIKDGTVYGTGTMKAGVVVPGDVPIIGGWSIADVTMYINTSPRVTMKGSFSVFEVGVFSVEVTLEPKLTVTSRSALRSWESELVYRIDADGDLRKAGEAGASQIAGNDGPYYQLLANFERVSKTYRTPGSRAASTVQLPGGSPTLIRVSYERAGVAADVEIIGPDGTRYAPSTVETDPNRAAPVGLLNNPAGGDLTYVFSAPMAGEYRVEIYNPDTLGEAAVEALVSNASPTFSFTQVASSGDLLELAWQAADADNDDADITLFIDENRTGANGLALELGRTIASGNSTVIDLSTLSLSPGDYWVYAQIDDSFNPPTTVYADAPVYVANPDAPAAVRGISASVSGTSALVSWQGSADPTVSGYSVKWTSDLDDPFYPSERSVEPDVEQALVEGLQPDTTYRFTVVAYGRGTDAVTRSRQLAEMAAAARGGWFDADELKPAHAEQIAALSVSLDAAAVPASEVADRLANADSGIEGVIVQPSLIAESGSVEIAIATTKPLSSENNPPRFLSNPPGILPVDTALVYPVDLADSDGDPMELNLVTGPAGMQVVDNELRWDGLANGELVEIELSASDGNDSTTQAWTLVVADVYEDRLRLSSAQPAVAEPGTPWQFEVAPEGGCAAPISYELFGAALDMDIDPEGQLLWSVPVEATDDLLVTVVAHQTCEDTVGGASQQYFVDVRQSLDTPLVTLPPGCEDPPGAVVSGAVDLPDDGGLAIRVDMSGNAPWQLIWSDGVFDEGVDSNPYFRPVSQPGIYTLTGFADIDCAGQSSGQGVVDPPTGEEIFDDGFEPSIPDVN